MIDLNVLWQEHLKESVFQPLIIRILFLFQILVHLVFSIIDIDIEGEAIDDEGLK
jgi:hypothetical protein